MEKPAPVEKPAAIVVAPPVVAARTDGKAKAMPPRPTPPKVIPPKGKQKKR
jgi:hypothetical protein